MKRNTTPLSTRLFSAAILTAAIGCAATPADAQTATFSGTVFNDGTGVSNGSISGTPISAVSNVNNTSSQQLYAYLVDDNSNLVISSATVSSGGYSLTGQVGENYSIVLSTTIASIGAVSPGSTLPQNWEFVGEGNTTVGDGAANGTIPINASSSTNLTTLHFALDRKPVGNDFTISNVTLNGNGRYTVPPAAFTGSDPEDGVYPAGLTGRTVNLYQAVNGTLFYNGVPVSFATPDTPTAIPNFQSSLVELQSTGSNQLTYFAYSIIDNAGVPEQSPNTISTPVALSIDLVRIAAQWKGADAEVSWTTASEEGTRAFIIERSTDGREFAEVGRVDSRSDRGISRGVLDYAFVDATAADAKGARLYYRVQELDVLNRTTASPVRTLDRANAAARSLEAGPVPAKGTLRVSMQAADAGSTVTFAFVDAAGRVAKTEVVLATDGTAAATLDVSSLAPGTYILRATGATGAQASQVVTIAR